MKKTKMMVLTLAISIMAITAVGCSLKSDEQTTTETIVETTSSTEVTTNENSDNALYDNSTYGFKFTLPGTWEGYTVIEDVWTSTSTDIDQSGPQIILRNPLWTETEVTQDIPILVFTHEQWADVLDEKFNVSAAPIPPSMLGENDAYVFALPARYNFAYPKGYEEVESILEGNPLVTYN
ncbi:hypothetical protein QE109_16545 [Fusibacter bizertensis]|uniref:ABC transporter substrate-binding protein n=1 Tax=Fusibacter bizertensis TaxID=1488331 RepID=A0ABT6NH59_9FIRM|nr:hypothetical protein [Fusibacter bizertensis]MDH8679769.1 hypothetical protein [Fusibacter bizertensis]